MPVLPGSTRGVIRRWVEFGGINRRYHLLVPSACHHIKSVPLVVLLHGGGGLGSQMLRFTGFDAIAQEHNFIVVCPDGVERHWNDGRQGISYRAHKDAVADVEFIEFLVDLLGAEFDIDSSRRYVTGFSNGGMMAYRLGLESSKFAALAAVAAGMPEELARKNAKIKMPVLIINGTEDPIVSFGGGKLIYGNREIGITISAPETAKFFANLNDCESKPKMKEIRPDFNESHIKIRQTRYEDCHGKSDVILLAVEGAGHVWPGQHPGAQYLPEERIGKACCGLNASRIIWDFFVAHPKPSP